VNVSAWMWVLTVVGVFALLGVDLVIVGRRPHRPSMREAAGWVVLYVVLAGGFGAVLWTLEGSTYAGEFFAGWLTEYSLSVDNLFVFVVIFGRFAVPEAYQQKVLTAGIVIALVLRALFIAVGAAAIEQFHWVFYLFGAFLLYTAVRLAMPGDHDDDGESRIAKAAARVLPVTEQYDGARALTRVDGRRRVTPLFVVMVVIGLTDLAFALDSIPAIYGLTKEPYLVFTANAFALMGLRQLYFLLGGLLDRLVYLSYGLAAVLGFIGIKLVLEALHTNKLAFINSGEPVPWAPEIPIPLSLGIIFATLLVATVASLVRMRRQPVASR